jgi:hypothetical protein
MYSMAEIAYFIFLCKVHSHSLVTFVHLFLLMGVNWCYYSIGNKYVNSWTKWYFFKDSGVVFICTYETCYCVKGIWNVGFMKNIPPFVSSKDWGVLWVKGLMNCCNSQYWPLSSFSGIHVLAQGFGNSNMIYKAPTLHRKTS